MLVDVKVEPRAQLGDDRQRLLLSQLVPRGVCHPGIVRLLFDHVETLDKLAISAS